MEAVFTMSKSGLILIAVLALNSFSAEPAPEKVFPVPEVSTNAPVAPTDGKSDQKSKKDQAHVSVHGYGLFGNRELKRMLEFLQKPGERPEYLDANYIEDAILILFSKLNQDAYLAPKIRADLLLDNGEKRAFTWEHSLQEPLPRPLRIKSAEFHIDPGILFYFEQINFSGIHSYTGKEARRFFEETDALIRLKKQRTFNDQRLHAGMHKIG